MIFQVVHSLGYLEAPQQQVAQPATEELPPERSQDGYFIEGLIIQTVLSVYALAVFKALQKLSLPFTIINFLFASLKLVTNFENAY